MSNLGTLTLDVNANTGPFTQKLKRAKTETGGFSRAVKGRAGGAMSSFSKSVNRLSSSLGGLITKLGLVGGAATAGLAVFSIKAAADLESTTVAFRTMLGSAQKADKVVSGLFDFSKKTPFEPDEVFAAGRRLLATGTGTGELHGELRTLGDIAAGSNSELADIVDIYSKIKTKGKASMEELNRLSERGININKVLGESLGKTGEEISKMVTQGKIKLPEIQAAFKKLTSDGGMFFDAMSAQSKTLNGLRSTLKGNLKAGAAELGKSLMHTTNLKGVLRAVNASLETFDWESFGQAAGDAFRVVLAGAQASTIALGETLKAKNALQSGFLTFSERMLLGAADLPGMSLLVGQERLDEAEGAISDSFGARRREVEESARRTAILFDQLNSTLEAAIKASEAPPPALIDFEQIEAERVKTLRHDKPMPETPSDDRVVTVLDKILAELKNPNIRVARPS